MTKPTLVVNTRDELRAEIVRTTAEYGGQVDLNYIDVSRVTDMHRLFHGVLFNGDISNWNVASLETCDAMFDESKFTGQCRNIDDRVSVLTRKEIDARFEQLIARNNPEEMARERMKVQRKIEKLANELRALKEGVSVLLDTTSVNWTN